MEALYVVGLLPHEKRCACCDGLCSMGLYKYLVHQIPKSRWTSSSISHQLHFTKPTLSQTLSQRLICSPTDGCFSPPFSFLKSYNWRQSEPSIIKPFFLNVSVEHLHVFFFVVSHFTRSAFWISNPTQLKVSDVRCSVRGGRVSGSVVLQCVGLYRRSRVV